MASTSTQPEPSGSLSRPSTRAAWTWWLLVIVALAVVAFVGGWLVGLSPVYTIVLVVALAGGSAAWLFAAQRRPNETASVAGVVGRVAITGAALLVVIQAVPIGRDHTNPPVTGEPAWSSPRTRELMVAACYGCHSNQVEWPWYANVAPMSWAISDHVDEGREAVNFSEFTDDPGEADDSIEVIREGSMPPAYFTRFGLHSDAKLSSSEIEELIAGLRATPGFGDDDDEGDGDDGDDE